MPNCAQCPLQGKKKVYPDGPIPAHITFIGEEPGKVEVQKGKGFVGPSGKLLWHQLCARWRIKREHVWVTNTLLCKSENVRLSSGAVLPKDEVQKLAAKCCMGRLLSELCVIDPVTCVPLGNLALKALLPTPHGKIMAYRGSISEVSLQQRYEDYITALR
jgi:DNA polymerase